MNNNYVLLSEKEWHLGLFEDLQRKMPNSTWTLIRSVDEFTFKNLNGIKPNKVFIPHWSHFIPKEVYENFECIVFHMTDLPYGRGGSPLQNLIERGHKWTKISALKVEKGLDTGDVYLKKDLNLAGTAREIFFRANEIIEQMIHQMIHQIVEEMVLPTPQKGEVTVFKRRKPEMSNIDKLDTINKVYDYIRMLDADGYPSAYIENDFFKFIFTNAVVLDDKMIEANVRIIKK